MEALNNHPVKILQVCAIDFSVDRLLKPLIKESMKQGYEVHNACADTGLFPQLEAEGLTMVNMPIERKISPISNMKTVRAFASLMKKRNTILFTSILL